jgi:hypothetical protein
MGLNNEVIHPFEKVAVTCLFTGPKQGLECDKIEKNASLTF